MEINLIMKGQEALTSLTVKFLNQDQDQIKVGADGAAAPGPLKK